MKPSARNINKTDYAVDSLPNTLQSAGNRRRKRYLLLNTLTLLLLVVPLLVSRYVMRQPSQRGFFCNDETILHPYKPETITALQLSLILAITPLLILAVGEYVQQSKTHQFCGHICSWLRNLLKQLVYIAYGLLLTLDITDIAKYTVGRLRPHFMAVCQPQLQDGSTCNNTFNQHRYIENYNCADKFSSKQLRESRFSFPSGHASMLFYIMVYLAFYLHKSMKSQSLRFPRLAIQFLLILVSSYISLTRVIDYYHFMSDILAGLVIGVLAAVVTAKYISKFWTPSNEDVSERSKISVDLESTLQLNETLYSKSEAVVQ